MSDKAPQISVIIVSYNTRQMTLDCLRALYAGLGGISAEVFVVDNASTDGSPAAIRDAYPGAHLIENDRNVGFGAANNHAMTRAQGEFFLLLNSDAFPKPGAIQTLVAYLQNHADVAVVGPRLLNRDGSLQLSCYRFPSPLVSVWENLLLTAAFPNHPLFGDFRAWPHDTERSVDFVIGACCLVRAAAAAEVGYFDESFFLYAEETDWCRRFHNAGWKVAFVPDAEVVHWNGGSGTRQADRVFCEFCRGQERFIRKYHGRTGLGVHRLMLIVGACLRMALFALRALVQPGKRTDSLTGIAEWKRILTWTLGFRGPGLKELSAR